MNDRTDTLETIKDKILKARSILIEVDSLYDPIRKGFAGNTDDHTGNSDQSVQIALMHTNDAVMLIKHEMAANP